MSPPSAGIPAWATMCSARTHERDDLPLRPAERSEDSCLPAAVSPGGRVPGPFPARVRALMVQLPVKSPRIDPRFTPFRLEIRPSKIHRLGVYAVERIPASRKVIEYTGERLNRWQASQRDSKRFTYLFAVDDYWTLDGAVNGSGAEIINHSCDPNLVSRVMKGH